MMRAKPATSDFILPPYRPSYSTQSLDRRKMVKIRSSPSINDEYILQPLQHQPFDYLHRPGSQLDIRFPTYTVNGCGKHCHQYSSRTLPRNFADNNSSTHSIKDVAL